MHKYSLTEIDRMRELVRRELFPAGGYRGGGSSDPAVTLIYMQQEQASEARVEERLRTYMLADVSPEELAKHVAEEPSRGGARGLRPYPGRAAQAE